MSLYQIEKPNTQSMSIGNIRVVTEKQKGIIIECSYFGDDIYNSVLHKRLYRNKDYTRALNTFLGYSITKENYTEMSRDNLNELIEFFKLDEQQKNEVLSILQTYYVSAYIGDAYLKLFSIAQELEIKRTIRNELLNDKDFIKEVLKNELENTLKNKETVDNKKKLKI